MNTAELYFGFSSFTFSETSKFRKATSGFRHGRKFGMSQLRGWTKWWLGEWAEANGFQTYEDAREELLMVDSDGPEFMKWVAVANYWAEGNEER